MLTEERADALSAAPDPLVRSDPSTPSGTHMALHAFTPQGFALGRILAQEMEGTLFVPARLLAALQEKSTPDTAISDNSPNPPEGHSEANPLEHTGHSNPHAFNSLSDHMAACFHQYAAHVFLGATGIAVRAIAPHLRGKTVDPAVVVCEIHGRFVISLLSGHVGGANALARNIAERTGGQAVITTATDSEGLPALDMLADLARCRVADPLTLKTISAVILAGHKPILCDPLRILDISAADRARLFDEQDDLAALAGSAKASGPNAVAVVVGIRPVPSAPGRLRLYARRLHVGMGYRKDLDADTLHAALRQVLKQENLAEDAIASLATADIKQHDPAIRELARRLDSPLLFFSPQELASVPVPNPSAKASEILGHGPLSVSEGAALLSAPNSPIVSAGPDAPYFPNFPASNSADTHARASAPALTTDSQDTPPTSPQALWQKRLLTPKCVVDGVTIAIALA